MADTLGIALAYAAGPVLLAITNAAIVWISNKRVATKITDAAVNASAVADRAERAIQAVHVLVNSTLTAALTAERDRTREAIEFLRRVIASEPDPKDVARLAELMSRESELTAQLADRAIQQSAVDEQARRERALAP